MSFQQGLSGLNGASKSLDVIGNNIANTATVGFKASQAQFADVYAASVFGVGGVQVGIGSTLANVAQSFTQGTITTTGNQLDLAITGEGFFQVSQDGQPSYTRSGQFHLDNLGFVVDNSGARLQGYAAVNGVLATSPGSDLQVTYGTGQPQVTSNVDAAINLDADSTATTFVAPAVTVPPTAPDPAGYNYTTTVTVYDTLGSEHSLALYFSKDAPTDPATWTVNAFMDGVASTIDIPQMTFPLTPPVPPATTPTPGVLIPPPTVPVVTSPTVMVGGVPTPLLINLDLTGSTMFSGKFGVNSLAQDGFSKGELATLAVTQEGVIQAQYTNGQALDVGQISLTSFINPNGLQSIGDNHWLATSDAGSANTQKANSGVLGLIRAGSVEESNVDLTAELVNLIIAQRAYQANAQTISAQSAILQTLVNIR